MKSIIGYIKGYFYESDRPVLALVTVLTAVLIFLNYYFGIDDWIDVQNSFVVSFFGRAVIFLLAFGLPWLFYHMVAGRVYGKSPAFIILIFIASFLFSLKVALAIDFHFSDQYLINNYWNHIVYYPFLLLMVVLVLFIVWWTMDRKQPFYGLKTKGMDWKPYIIMLLVMIPLIALASTQPDFLAVYPKLKLINNLSFEDLNWWHRLLFELSYGSDFFTIEIFFRGFLILAFVKWAGKDAILPMACFYCTIHFGKPLGECISSYFGGMLLGIVVYHTRSIFGGLMVHLGIAWLMELGGYLGNANAN
jgi:hypothetical protein